MVMAAGARLALGYTAMLVHAVQHAAALGRPAVRGALARQLRLSGVQAVPAVALVAVLLGAVVPTQAMLLLGSDNEVVLKTVVWGGIQELGPLVVALLLVVRSGVAIAAETALMRLRPGISDALWQGATQEDEVVIPRVLGLALSAAMLVAYFQAFAIVAALVASAGMLGTPLDAEAELLLGSGVWWQVLAAVGKGALFGLGIGVVSCYHGLHARPQALDIPKAAVAAGVGSLACVFAIDLLAAWLRWL